MASLRLLLTLLGCCHMAIAVSCQPDDGQQGVDFSQPGPFGTRSWKTRLSLPSELRATLTNTLSLNITVPQNTTDSSTIPPPYPVLIFFNGFQARASYYHLLAQRLCSWGYIVVQYNTPFLRIFNVAAEMLAFEPLVEWLGEQNDTPGSPLFGLADLEQLVVGGHSRGGKLATLLFAENPLIQAAYLVDPVDNTQFSPESPQNPSATKALAASGRKAGITGAGIISSCNPEGGNYKDFWAATANGSWLGVLPGASHTTFMDAGCLLNRGLDLLCKKGGDSRGQVAELTATPMLAWFYQELQVPNGSGSGPSPQPLLAFYQWASQQEGEGRLVFSIKGGLEGGAPGQQGRAAGVKGSGAEGEAVGGEAEGPGPSLASTPDGSKGGTASATARELVECT